MYIFIKNNQNLENNIIELKKLNYVPIILYNLNIENKNKTKQNITNLIKLKNQINNEYNAIQIQIKEFNNQIPNIINELKKEFNITIGLGGLNKINQFFIEQTKIDFLQDPQNTLEKQKIDYIHHFNSGLNQILLKLLKEKQINLFFSLNFFENNNKYQISKEIGRINQNIKFSNKYNVPIYLNYIIINQNQIKSINELNSILNIFNISTFQIKQNQSLLQNIIKKNIQKQSKKFINEKINLN